MSVIKFPEKPDPGEELLAELTPSRRSVCSRKLRSCLMRPAIWPASSSLHFADIA